MKDPISAVVVEKGWFETFKEKLNIDGLLEKMKLDRSKLIEIGLYLGIGFLAGFLFKKYAKYLFVVIVTVVAILLLQQFGFIKCIIHWNKIQGLQPVAVPMGASVWSVYWEWFKVHFVVVLSFSVGFFVGFKVG